MTTAPRPEGNASIIARNSFWFGAEMAFVFVSALVSAIIMARVLGPQKLGYFNYVQWLANISGAVGSLGIPMTTRKYMAEYLGRGEAGIARAVFFATMRLQVLIALLITSVALVVVVLFGDPAHRLVSAIQVASILPAMAVYVPAQANTARENLRANVIGSVVQGCIYFAAVILSLTLGWGLLGIAIGILAGRTMEFFVRTLPVLTWVNTLPRSALPDELRKRMLSFSGQGTLLMLLNIVVWDRSDIIFLKLLSNDIAQISFYSVAFNLAERAMVMPQTFGTAIGATIMAQYGRDKTRLSAIASSAARYMLVLSVPLLLGLAALSSPGIRLVYGNQYLPAIPVLSVACILALSKVSVAPAQQLLQADEKQAFLVWWGCFCGVVNIVLDLILIPHYAALGAAFANGIAQTLAAVGIWARAMLVFKLKLDLSALVKTVVAGAAMALCVLPVALAFKPAFSAVAGIAIGAAVFVLALRILRVLQPDDRTRFRQLLERLPSALRGIATMVIDFASGGRALPAPAAAIAGSSVVFDAVEPGHDISADRAD